MDINNTSITRRLDASLNGLEDEFKALYSTGDYEYVFKGLRESKGMSDYPSKLKRLYRMMDACDIRYEKNQSIEYYESLVDSAGIPTFQELEDHLLYALFSRYEDYPSPEDYMKRLVDRLCSEDDPWNKDTLRLRILKQFIKYGDYLRGAKCGGHTYIKEYAVNHGANDKSVEEVLHNIDDKVFDVLENANKQQKKFEGTYGLLKVADDLAVGKFRMSGATKKELYMFAMVYGMTYYVGPEHDEIIYDPRTDIEKNLFSDYYNNNFVRFITDAYREKIQEYELDPSGKGINYKNYAEMVYLYYISKDIPVLDKIRLSNNMIENISKDMLGKGAPEEWGKASDDRRWSSFNRRREKDRLNSEDILNRGEDEFREFLCDHYFCDTSNSYQPNEKAVRQKSPLELENDQIAAYNEYLMILDGIRENEMSLENCNYGLWFTDVAAFYKKGYESLCSRNPDVDPDKFELFMKLLLAVNNYIGYTVREDISDQPVSKEKQNTSVIKTKALFVESPERVTRSSIITAFYYYYNSLQIGRNIYGRRSFEETFNEFKKEVDEYLENAGYQLFSGKNLFDVLIAFSSYAYIYL